MDNRPYVYKLTNPITGEFYIGYRSANKVSAENDLGKKYFTSSKTVRPRFNEFNSTILKEFTCKEDAIDFEQRVIHSNWGNPLLLNKVCHHGKLRFVNTLPLTEEIRKKMGDKRRGVPRSEETKKKIGKAHKGKIVSEKTKELLRSVAIGRIISEETRKKLSESLKGKKKPAGFGQKIAANNRKRVLSPETRLKMSLAKKNGHQILVCRICDRKEMLLRHFFRFAYKECLIYRSYLHGMPHR